MADFPQWGVMFTDGSVAHRWNGKTQRQRATEYRDYLNREYAPDRYKLVCRLSLTSEWVVMEYQEPPEGWFTYGHHADQPFEKLEFSDEHGEDGLPLWERPVK